MVLLESGTRAALAPTAVAGAARAAVRAVLAESRPGVQALAGVRFVCGSGLMYDRAPHRIAVLAGWLCLSVAVYVYNGVTDVDTDRPNGSSRPIAAGRLQVATARRWCAGLIVAGLTAVSFGGPLLSVLALAFLGLGWAYSSGPCWKNSWLSSAVVIGLGAALTYAAGMAVANDGRPRDLLVMILVSGWIGVASMSKDFSDVGGDALAGRRTTPVVLGPARAAALLSRFAILTSVAVAVVAVAAHSALTLLTGVSLVLGSLALAVNAHRYGSCPDRTVRRRPYRTFMTTQCLTDGTLFVLLAN